MSGHLYEHVLVLRIMDHERALLVPLAYDEIVTVDAWIDGHERHRTVVVPARRDRAFPLAEIEDAFLALLEHSEVAERRAPVMPGELGRDVRVRGCHQLLELLDMQGPVLLRFGKHALHRLGSAVE